jgi:flagellar biosynthesis/type III secretory pathway chaperone
VSRRHALPLLDTLLAVLRAEQQALVSGAADALPALADSKAQALDELNQALRVASPGERRALTQAAASAQRLNDTNAALVAIRMAANRARLDTLLSLTGQAGSTTLYGVRGDLPAYASAARASARA